MSAVSVPAACADQAAHTGCIDAFRRVHSYCKLRQLLNGNLPLLSREEQQLAKELAAGPRKYLVSYWPKPGTRDDAKRALMAALSSDASLSSKELESLRLAVLEPPRAQRRPHAVNAGGEAREDAYYWLRDDAREDPAVLAHVRAESAHAEAALADVAPLRERLYREMRARVVEADTGVPYKKGEHQYYSRTEEGAQYRVHCRRRLPAGSGAQLETDGFAEAPEEVVLDENEEARAHKFYATGSVSPSPDGRLLAYSADTVGGEKFALCVRDVGTRAARLRRPIPNTTGAVEWSADGRWLFYLTRDALERPHKVWRHLLGSDPADDVCVFHEPDDTFYVDIDKSASERFIWIGTGSAVTSDARYIPADQPEAEPRLVLPRRQDVEYSVQDAPDGSFLLLLRDEGRPNSELTLLRRRDLQRAGPGGADPGALVTLVPHRQDVKLEHFDVWRRHVVLQERRRANQEAVVYDFDPTSDGPLAAGHPIQFDEPAYTLGVHKVGDFECPLLALYYASLKTPPTTIHYNVETGRRAVKKVQPVGGDFDPERYATAREWARADDGTQVPVSVVYRADLVRMDGSAPLLLDAYGAYEICNDPHFSSARLPLLDRGVVYAIAHVRGGGEMGRRWYESGKFLRKKNTFSDVVACARHLRARGYAGDRVCLEGRSAGGLTVGATLNLRPDLFCGAILGVPFVDCLTTMLDESIPLTAIEWEEWGNPAQKEYYDYMRSYSPVDNLRPGAAYPHIFVSGGLHDPRVGYWEPAKYVAKLRELKADQNLLVFKCDMGAGHFSQSGRFDRLKERALEVAFLLKACDMTEVEAC